jgi:hypothetical protein
VSWAWVVNPLARRIEVFRAGDGEWLDVIGVEDQGPVSLPPFDGVELDTVSWFGG